MPDATADDVRIEIDTSLSTSDINDILERVSRDIARQDNTPASGTDDRRDLEAVLAALRIATGNAPSGGDRTASAVSSGRSRVDYDGSTVEELRRRARFIGAPEALVGGQPQADFEVF